MADSEGVNQRLVEQDNPTITDKMIVSLERHPQPHLQLVETSNLQPTFPGSDGGARSNDPGLGTAEYGSGSDVDELHMPENELISAEDKRETPNSQEILCCSNCNSSSHLDGWVALKEDLITCRTFNVITKTLADENLTAMDVLTKLFKFEKETFDKFENDSEKHLLCPSCIESLRKLCQLHSEFISLSVLSDSLLSKLLFPNNKAKLEGSKPTQTRKRMESYSKSQARSKKCSEKSKQEVSTGEQEEIKLIKSVSSIQILNERREKGESCSRDNLVKLPKSQNFLPKPSNSNSKEEVTAPAGGKGNFVDEDVVPDCGSNGDDDGEIGCDQCFRRFSSHVAMKVHQAWHQKKNHNIVCRDCGKEFKTPKAVESHQRIDHNGLKPHQCSYEGCEKQFRLKKKLQLHIKVMHEKRKPYPCPKCEKSFRTKYDLKVHDVGKHVQGDNSIGCSKCRRKFPTRQDLEKHAITHEEDKPHVCRHCDKGFQTISRLKLHLKSHDQVPSFICSVCGKAYKHKRDLLLHEVVHQDESTFRFGCGNCPRRFYRIDLLRNHQSNENHFSPETVGPSISKFHKSSRKAKSQKSTKDLLKHNKTKTDRKRKAKSEKKKESKPPSDYPTLLPVVETNVSSTYTPTPVENLDLSHFPLTSVLFSDSNILSQVPLLSNSPSKDQLTSAQFTNEMLSINEPSLSLQPISTQGQSNNGSTIFNVNRDTIDRNISAINFTAGAEQIGIDVINAFINNLN